jgi:uncharacterized protein (DUF433 family)
MPPIFTAAELPLVSDQDGVVRVGNTRVTLDTIIAAFRQGMTPEGIVEQYPTVQLADAYSVIGHALAHPAEIEAYLSKRDTQAAQVRLENETQFDPLGVRDRLLSRRRTG